MKTRENKEKLIAFFRRKQHCESDFFDMHTVSIYFSVKENLSPYNSVCMMLRLTLMPSHI
jgi:hypothetical protein